jgi:hypothetical protein
MKKIILLTVRSFLFFLVTVLLSCQPSKYTTNQHKVLGIERGFIQLSETNRPWCYWYWINDDISKSGVTKDLEAMKDVGFGAALIGNINPAGVDGRVPLFSDEWWDIMVHAVSEGKRLGVDIGIFNCPGWSQSGGPWVTAEKAMRYLVYSETIVTGPKEISIELPQPTDIFQDIRIVAIPNKDKVPSPVQVTANPNASTIDYLTDDNLNTVTILETKENSFTLSFLFEKEINARSLTLYPDSIPFKCNCELTAVKKSSNHPVIAFTFDRSNMAVNVGPQINGPLALNLDPTLAKQFKLHCRNVNSKQKVISFREISISEDALLDRYVEKQLAKMLPTPFPTWTSYLWNQQSDLPIKYSIPLDSVIDLQESMNSEGTLNWQVPAGEWTILRMGMTPTGTRNAPSAPQGQGYEIDKMSETLSRFHFEQFVGEFLK